jgi:hypothetical protein
MTKQGFYIGCGRNIQFDRINLEGVTEAFHIENSREITVTQSFENRQPLAFQGDFL